MFCKLRLFYGDVGCFSLHLGLFVPLLTHYNENNCLNFFLITKSFIFANFSLVVTLFLFYRLKKYIYEIQNN